ncbi:MAG: inorganic diphosphatase [Hyphomicrobiaceae bacterium]
MSEDTFQVFIENEADSATKRTYDETTLQLLKTEQVSRRYPYPYGFVTGTLSGDGDSVDCFVVTNEVLRSGDLVNCRAVFLLEQNEDGDVDHKVIATLAGSSDVIGERELASIRSFIASVFSHIPDKKIELGSLHGASEAARFIRDCRE